jgi:hypothetical protein
LSDKKALCAPWRSDDTENASLILIVDYTDNPEGGYTNFGISAYRCPIPPLDFG